jgi:hypothetical protein
MRVLFATGLLYCFAAGVSFAQAPKPLPLKAGDHPEILFAADAPPTEKDEHGKPALASLEPIAFLVGDKFRDCSASGPADAEDGVSKAVLNQLNRAYTPGRRYPLWWRGALWGEAEAVHSCMDQGLDLTGCFRLHPQAPGSGIPKDLHSTVLTGNQPAPDHPALRSKASPEERTIFLQSASAAYAEHDIRATPAHIRTDDVWKTQLRADHVSLAGNTLAQISSGKPLTYNSYRIFLVPEEDDGRYVPVLASFRKVRFYLDQGGEPPKPGEELDEGNGTDKEVFFDNFPLFPGEPDAIITRHTYYEDWNFSIYRRSGSSYQLVYTGCGGGA